MQLVLWKKIITMTKNSLWVTGEFLQKKSRNIWMFWYLKSRFMYWIYIMIREALYSYSTALPLYINFSYSICHYLRHKRRLNSLRIQELRSYIFQQRKGYIILVLWPGSLKPRREYLLHLSYLTFLPYTTRIINYIFASFKKEHKKLSYFHLMVYKSKNA